MHQLRRLPVGVRRAERRPVSRAAAANSGLRVWVEREKIERGQGKPGALTAAEREELARLRKENRILQMEREILKKATAFFAKESK